MSGKKCPEGCACSRHNVSDELRQKRAKPRKKCEPGCTCSRHTRVLTEEHKANIAAANRARKGGSKCPPGCTCRRHQVYYRGGSKKGRKFSQQARQKITEGARSREYTEEQYQRLVDQMLAHRRDPEWEAKRVASLRESLTDTTCPVGCTCGKHATPLSLPHHKNSDGRKGYIYIIKFSTGVVKVGRTTSPRRRIMGQLYVASKLGVEAENIWLSAFHENYKTNELLLLERLGTPWRGVEHFRTEFSRVVKTAEAIIERYGGE